MPEADDRRSPGIAHMTALGQQALSAKAMLRVMSTYPTQNSHTDYTGVFVPRDGTYDSQIWT